MAMEEAPGVLGISLMTRPRNCRCSKFSKIPTLSASVKRDDVQVQVAIDIGNRHVGNRIARVEIRLGDRWLQKTCGCLD